MNAYAVTWKEGRGTGYIGGTTEEHARKRFKRMFPECKLKTIEFSHEVKKRKKVKSK